MFLFSRVIDRWYTRIQYGFTHVVFAEVVDEDLLFIIEPGFSGATMMLRTYPTLHEWDNYCVVEVSLNFNKSQKLIRPLIQTCATICQYLAGINLHTIWAQTMFERLTCEQHEYLSNYGIRSVRIWEQKQ